jgi:hypothetical protein
MTPREYAKQNRHIGEAWEDGKTIQFKCFPDDPWQDWKQDARPAFNVINMQFRIKPEPPKPKYRAWNQEEVPVGAVLDFPSSRVLIIGCNIHGDIATADASLAIITTFESSDLVNVKYKWKWPHEPETAWKPCSVEVAP